MPTYILLGYKETKDFDNARERLLKDLGDKMPTACFARSIEEMKQTLEEMEDY